MNIRLRAYMSSATGWGHIQGRKTREALCVSLQNSPPASIIRLSLDGVERLDVSFAREAIVELARSERGRRGICLDNVSDPDLLANLDGAAWMRGQPLVVWDNQTLPCVIGPQPSAGLREMFQYVLSVPGTRTSEAAAALSLHIPNASNKLKQLWIEGYILRREQSAGSGGLEYAYFRIA